MKGEMSNKKYRKEEIFMRVDEKQVECMREAISLMVPAVVYGEVGRSFLVSRMHREIVGEKGSLVEIDSREICDSRVLGGFYGVKDGNVEYVRGMLAESMLRGDWVLFKRIDKNNGLYQYLSTVLKYRKLLCSDGTEICAHNEFRVLFTSYDKICIDEAVCVGPVLFVFEDAMRMFESECVRRLLCKAFEGIGTNTNGWKCGVDKGMECFESCSKVACKNGGWCLKEGSNVCKMHFISLIRMRKRLKDVCGTSIDERVMMYQTICNVLLKHESNSLRCALVLSVVPDVVLHGNELAKTRSVEWGLFNIVWNVRNNDHTLLIGDTGVGKTSMVEYLSQKSRFFVGMPSKLRVVNMSADFDGMELIGGYGTLNVERAIEEIAKDVGRNAPLEGSNKDKLEFLRRSELMKADASEKIIARIDSVLNVVEKKVYFVYKEGLLTECMMKGEWLLLDEINLCSEETLDLIDGVLEKKRIFLYESGDLKSFEIHPDFMLFACMNPGGDFGKKRYEGQGFNVVYVHDFSTSARDVELVAHSILKGVVNEESRRKVCEFFLELKDKVRRGEIRNEIEPLISGRTFVRVLRFIKGRMNGGVESTIYDAYELFVFTQFDFVSRMIAVTMFSKHFGERREEGWKTKVKDGFVLTPRIQMCVRTMKLGIECGVALLLQGDTSTGKTSMVMHLAKEIGRRVIRINNHEHTEASDYIGGYSSTTEGVKFRDGVLVQAMRRGDWVILDELNLAPSEVLEILNRLLDDNRQIYVPETDEVVYPHRDFRIFATQNVGYGGRKGLSKAFRNRFVELFFRETGDEEVLEIVHGASGLPMSFCRKMLAVYSGLKTKRSINVLITLRELFRWACRGPGSAEDVCFLGMSMIHERQRGAEDKRRVQEIFIESFGVRSVERYLRMIDGEVDGNDSEGDFLECGVCSLRTFCLIEKRCEKRFVLTKSFRRLVNLVVLGLKSKEPVLIVGETGIGKTKVCDIVSELFGRDLRTLSMHGGVESSDFLGSFAFEESKIVWRDGPLVKAMKNGDVFLIDEINLAEDSVLERLNSLLEPHRMIYIAETGEEVVAHENFMMLATMNPGGDFGKRELSPALRNRFTEIYFEIQRDEVIDVFDRMIEVRLGEESGMGMQEMEEFKRLGRRVEVSVRKLELMIDFICRRYAGKSGCVICKGEFDAGEVWNEALEIVGEKAMAEVKAEYVEHSGMFGVYPYFLQDVLPSVFDFESPTSAVNLKRILRAMSLGRGIMLEGEPGIGKTSIVQAIARRMGRRSIRINLSEHTELSDLVGSYIPVGGQIKFVESELLEVLREGGVVIFDEINLCTQSVIEGMNSVLDYRRKLFIPEVVVDVNEKAFIFATLNPHTSRNGRKVLPKSFLDRFIRIGMDIYGPGDVEHIMHRMYAKPVIMKELSLRENIRMNKMGIFEEREVEYVMDERSIRVGSVTVNRKDCKNADVMLEGKGEVLKASRGFVMIHSQLEQIEKIMKCVEMSIPVVLSGGVETDSLLYFISWMYEIDVVMFSCHKDTDVCDLLGQYQKKEDGMFEWSDSVVVKGVRDGKMVIFSGVEHVDKSVFDRLNSLFESERMLNVYEKGIDTDVAVSALTKLVIVTKDAEGLSPALLDRCMHVKLSNELDYIDVWKLFMRSQAGAGLEKIMYKDFEGVGIEKVECDVRLDLRRFWLLGRWPKVLSRCIRGIFNTIDENEIQEMFRYEEKHIEERRVDMLGIEFYKKIGFEVCRPCNDEERTNLLREMNGERSEMRRMVMFIKSADFCVLKRLRRGEGCSLNFARCVSDLKMKIIGTLGSRKFSDYERMKKISKCLSGVQEVGIGGVEFDDFFMELIEEGRDDPLRMLRNELVCNMNAFENRSMKEIHDMAMCMYKYGRGSVGELIRRYEEGVVEYKMKIEAIECRMKRDYARFTKEVRMIDFCSYMCGDRKYYDEFADVFDYYLVHLFGRWIEGDGCSGMCKMRRCNEEVDGSGYENEESVMYSTLCLNLLESGPKIIDCLRFIDCKQLKDEFSRYLYGLYYGRPVSRKDLVFESIVFDVPVSVCKKDWIDFGLKFSEEDLNECLRGMFDVEMRARVIEEFRGRVVVHESLVKMMSKDMLDMGIFTKIEDIMEHVENKVELRKKCLVSKDKLGVCTASDDEYSENLIIIGAEQDECNAEEEQDELVHRRLEMLYKDLGVCEVERNYRYFLYLVTTSFTLEEFERYFFDCCVYEHVERIRHAREFAIKSKSPMVYNATLKYVGFEIEKMYDARIRSAKSKLRKDPGLYKKTLAELRRFLVLPVTNVLKLEFKEPDPVCQEHHPGRQAFILKDRGECECKDWIELSKKFDRREIARGVAGIVAKKNEVIEMFFGRMPTDMFSYSEVCLGKVISQMVDDASVLSLMRMGIEHPYVPFLYFVFNFCRDASEVEEVGEGMEAGQGNVNVSEQVKHEDEIEDDYGDQEMVSESDGIDFDNDGNASTVSDVSEECDSGVDGSNEDEKDEEEEEENESDNTEEEEVDNKMEIEEEGYGSEGSEDEGIEMPCESLLEEDISENNNESESSDIENDEEEEEEQECGEDDEENEDDEKNVKMNEYRYEESKVNSNQTCDKAENYERYVYGGNRNDKALCEGEGQEKICGDSESGEGEAVEATVRIMMKDEDCSRLTNMLKMVIEANKSNKYKGDFKSGKKLNMKRLVPYIASGFRRDRIWMKRQKSEKREYVLRLFVDNSKSMYNQEMVDMLLSLYSKISKSFSILGIPVEVYKFGNSLERCEVKNMKFNESQTRIEWIEEFGDGINVILTDGLFQNVGKHRPNFLVLLIDKCNVRKMSKVMVSEGSVFVQKYLDVFPLKYCVIGRIEELESTFVMALGEMLNLLQ
ncbi:AAA domain-containing protein [Ordospora pajunii]|uniref:AAA domain-containing protein n=1 Tax=Ordospora pajunii TaxID=3039483 RepID=UPI00295279A5|nr:AAA domain-containing protein [Ordospora pajunii]KAH9410867.1 AAA domain-containing protein [Ordospora pajunii]